MSKTGRFIYECEELAEKFVEFVREIDLIDCNRYGIETIYQAVCACRVAYLQSRTEEDLELCEEMESALSKALERYSEIEIEELSDEIGFPLWEFNPH